MAHDYQLPLGDRDDDPPRRKVINGRVETNAEYVRRLAIEEHGMPPTADDVPEKKPWREWMGKPSVEEVIDRTFDKARDPGEEG